MQSFLQDIRHAARTLRRSPGFALIAALTLSLGIGGVTAIFSVVDTVLLRPLPFEEQDRLVSLGGRGASYPEMLDWREQADAFEGVALYANSRWPYDLTSGERPERVEGVVVSPSFFEVLRARPALGRVFSLEREGGPAERVIVLSDRFWRARLGADPEAVGRTLLLNGYPYTVIGVMPAGFAFPDPDAELWSPLTAELPDAASEDMRSAHLFFGFARLAPGATAAGAQAQMDLISRRLERLYPEEGSDQSWRVIPLRDALTGDVRPALLILLAAVVLLLLITASNVAGLHLARAAARQRDLAVRRALGAGWPRLVRELLTESVLLAAAGGVLGVLLAYLGVEALVSLGPAELPRVQDVTLDGRVLAFASGVSLLVGAAVGLAPALLAREVPIADSLVEAGRGTGGGVRRSRLRRALAVGEVALAFLLLVGAGLLLESLWNLSRVEPGFDPRDVLTARISLPESRYPDVPEQISFFRDVVTRVSGLPGVVSVGAVGDLPLVDDFYAPHNLAIEGRPVPAGEEPEIAHRPVTPGYFATMRIPVLRGRGIEAGDRERAPLVAVVNRTMAGRLWAGGDPIGKRVRWAQQDEVRWMTIVGVVGDVRPFTLGGEEEPALYSPHAQSPFAWRRRMTLVVRGASGSLSLARAVEREVWQVDRELPVTDVRSMEAWIGSSLARQRFQSLVLGLFAGVALALAGLGIYGVLAQGVAQRTREIGVRLALGARARQVMRLVVGQGLAMALAGIGFGFVAAALLTRLLTGLLYGVTPTDPVTFIGIAALVATVALLASGVPAWRAARTDPLTALRHE